MENSHRRMFRLFCRLRTKVISLSISHFSNCIFAALIKKYIDQNGGKSQFALTAVTPGTPINPAFPLVKVSKQEFQLIPVQDPPESSSTEEKSETETKHYDASELTNNDDAGVKSERPSPDKKGTFKNPQTSPKTILSDEQPKKIALRNLSASSSPTKPVSAQSTPEQAASIAKTEEGISIAPADATRNAGSIANQVAIRKARQPVVKKKEKPIKIKKVNSLSVFFDSIACLSRFPMSVNALLHFYLR